MARTAGALAGRYTLCSVQLGRAQREPQDYWRMISVYRSRLERSASFEPRAGRVSPRQQDYAGLKTRQGKFKIYNFNLIASEKLIWTIIYQMLCVVWLFLVLDLLLSSQQDYMYIYISLALRAPWRDATYTCERGVLSEYPAARARASYWLDKIYLYSYHCQTSIHLNRCLRTLRARLLRSCGRARAREGLWSE